MHLLRNSLAPMDYKGIKKEVLRAKLHFTIGAILTSRHVEMENTAANTRHCVEARGAGRGEANSPDMMINELRRRKTYELRWLVHSGAWITNLDIGFITHNKA